MISVEPDRGSGVWRNQPAENRSAPDLAMGGSGAGVRRPIGNQDGLFARQLRHPRRPSTGAHMCWVGGCRPSADTGAAQAARLVAYAVQGWPIVRDHERERRVDHVAVADPARPAYRAVVDDQTGMFPDA
jgi:hypothetical protein